MDIYKKIQEELNLKEWQVKNVIQLIDDGNTIPFISRYRKEMTGSLNDEVLRNFDDRLKYLRNLEERKQTIITNIKEQGKLTKELEYKIIIVETLVELEDLYRPYKQKRKTRAMKAKEKGLEPLANLIIEQNIDKPIEEYAKDYVNEELKVNSINDVIEGAKDIISEIISDNAEYRKWIRKNIYNNANIVAKCSKEDSDIVYKMYFDYTEILKKIPGHRILAMNRGEKEKQLSIKLDFDIENIFNKLYKEIIIKNNVYTNQILKDTIEDSFKRLIYPSIERDIRNELTEKSEEAAIKVFGENLKQILMQPPIIGKIVLGLDPAYRTGCKLAVVDEIGKVLDTAVIYPTPPHNKVEEASKVVKDFIKKYNINIVSIGNGTASRESEKFISELIRDIKNDVCYVITNEAGASVYSASKLATKEFPDFDVAQRSAVSIARRIQDPMAELVKIDPKSIGVGQYQHDMNQKKLKESLTNVVEDTVNNVGVDLNTASVSLLSYISGISESIAKNIVEYREVNNKFNSRKELLKVKKLGPKAYEQCAGFLRIHDGKNVLDNTGIHPESYKIVENILDKLDLCEDDIKDKKVNLTMLDKDIEKVANEFKIGVPTLKDIIKDLNKPGLDPRDEMPKPILRNDVLEIKDLREGMILNGTVRNLVDFGAFVDIGVHQDGLVHISEITNKFIKHPLDILSIGDIVKVVVINVDSDNNKISLSIKQATNK